MMKAYSLLELKQVDDNGRVLRGIATTPTVDRVGDIVEPLGVVFRGPINLHLYHKHDMPVGHVEFGKPTKVGIPFTASIPDVAEEGTVRERTNEAWHSVKYKLLRAVSIGFHVLEDGAELMKNGGLRFTKWEMVELSLVGVPANPDAVITAFKSADPSEIREALGVARDGGSEREALVRRLLKGGVPLVQSKSEVPATPKGAVRLITK
jgi:HK97 family phage prohead protease